MKPKGFLIKIVILSPTNKLNITTFQAIQNTVQLVIPAKYGILKLKDISIQENTSYNE